MGTKIIGLHNGHDASITAIEDGEILGHWELERVLEIKHFCGVDKGNEIADVLYDHVLPRLNWQVNDIDWVAFAGKTEWKKTEFAEYVPQYNNFYKKQPFEFGNVVLRGNYKVNCYSVVHHINHMAYAYFTSPFNKEGCILFSYDGIGDGTSTVAGWAKDNKVRVEAIYSKDLPERNNGIGLCYSYLGRLFPFLGNDLLATAGKAMGLSSYGTAYIDGPIFDICDKMIREWMPDPSKYKDKLQSLIGTTLDFGNPMNKECQNVMATIQYALESYVRGEILYWRTFLHLENNNINEGNLAMAGGCALNVQANTALLDTGTVDKLYVPPATSDCGVSIGAALYVYYHILENEFGGIDWHDPYLGDTLYNAPPKVYSASIEDSFEEELNKKYPTIRYDSFAEGDWDSLTKRVAAYLDDGQIIAWAQGRAEIGPRALGNRSILCSAAPHRKYSGDMSWLKEWEKDGSRTFKKTVNEKVKNREFWRPFAPIALLEDAKEQFVINDEQPYMLEAPLVRGWLGDIDMGLKLSSAPPLWWSIPAVVHVDGTARVQTVTEITNPLMHLLLSEYKKLGNPGVLLNTSLNDRGVPINNSFDQIIKLLLNSDIDYAVIGTWIFWNDQKD